MTVGAIVRTVAPYVGDSLVRAANEYYNSGRQADFRETFTRALPGSYSGRKSEQVVVREVGTRSNQPQYHMGRSVTRVYSKAPVKVTFAKARTMTRANNYPANRQTYVVAQPRAEIKVYTAMNLFLGAPTTTGTIQEVTTVPQGTSSTQRSGNVIKTLSCRYTGVVNLGGSAQQSQQIRVIWFWWNQGYTSPSVSSILESLSWLAMYNQTEARNYQIVSDRIYNLNAQAGIVGAFSDYDRPIKGSFRLGKNITYVGTSGTSGDRNLCILMIAANSLGGCNINTQLKFVDV